MTANTTTASNAIPQRGAITANIFIRKDPAGNIKIDKEKSTERVDGAVAAVMALDRAIRGGNAPQESVYDRRGLLFIDMN